MTAIRLVAVHPENDPPAASSNAAHGCVMSIYHALRAAALAAITPLLEKNAIKAASVDVPFVFSMSRLVVLAFAIGMVRQLWRAGIVSWPEATLAIAIVLALPLLGAFERAAPEQLIDVTKTLLNRFGVGDQRVLQGLYAAGSSEPSPHDKHWSD